MSVRPRIALPVVLALAFFAASSAGAQDLSLVPSRVAVAGDAPVAAPHTNATDPTVALAPAGPTMQAASVAVRHQEAPLAAAPRRGSTPGTALMVVGGAAVLVGLIIGNNAGNAIAVGGAVMGLVGLYEYLQ